MTRRRRRPRRRRSCRSGSEGAGLCRGGRAAGSGVARRWRPARAASSSAPTAPARACCCGSATGCCSPPPAASPGSGRSGAARAAQAMVFQRPVMLRRSVGRQRRLRPQAAPGRRQRAAGPDRRGAGGAPVSRRSPRQPARVAVRRRAAAPGAGPRLGGGARGAVPRRADRQPRPVRDPRRREHRSPSIHRAGTKIVMTTHDLGQARRLADEILFLNHGRLHRSRPGSNLLRRTGHTPRPPPSSREIGDMVDALETALPRRLPCIAHGLRRIGAGGRSLHHHCVDDLDPGQRPVRVSAADLHQEDRDRGTRRRGGDRPGPQDRPAGAMPTCSSSTIGPARRNSSPTAMA